jgi:hypothetical protein
MAQTRSDFPEKTSRTGVPENPNISRRLLTKYRS